jgi:hypothetical protein
MMGDDVDCPCYGVKRDMGSLKYTSIQIVASLEAETRDVSKHFGHEPEKAQQRLRRDGPKSWREPRSDIRLPLP